MVSVVEGRSPLINPRWLVPSPSPGIVSHRHPQRLPGASIKRVRPFMRIQDERAGPQSLGVGTLFRGGKWSAAPERRCQRPGQTRGHTN